MPDQEKLFVRRVGEGEPVLVLSGLGMQSWQWLPFLFASRKKYEFIIPDWRGFGGSNLCAVPELDAISSHWQDLNSLLQQQNLQQFKLIGYSMGATTAMHGMRYGQLTAHLSSYLQIDAFGTGKIFELYINRELKTFTTETINNNDIFFYSNIPTQKTLEIDNVRKINILPIDNVNFDNDNGAKIDISIPIVKGD